MFQHYVNFCEGTRTEPIEISQKTKAELLADAYSIEYDVIIAEPDLLSEELYKRL